MTIFEKQKQEIAAIDREIRQVERLLGYSNSLNEKISLVRKKKELNQKRADTRRAHILFNFENEEKDS